MKKISYARMVTAASSFATLAVIVAAPLKWQ